MPCFYRFIISRIDMRKKIQPSLFGIHNSNRDYTNPETWGKNQFNSSFPTALAAYMYSKNKKCVYIKIDEYNNIKHSQISTEDLFGISPLSEDTFYAFESVFTPFQQFYKGVIPRIDLVIQNKNTGECTRGLEIKMTALPDNSTCELENNEYSCEIVIRPDTISYLACSIVQKYVNDRSELTILASDLAKIKHWDNEREIIEKYFLLTNFVDNLSMFHCPQQSPLVLQPI